MKPLLATRIRRDRQTVGDWVKAADQLTDQGRADFAERQRQRMEAAQRDRAEAKAKTVPIKGRKRA